MVHIGSVDVVVFASCVVVVVVAVVAVLSTYKQRQLKKLQRQSEVKQLF